jgi:hypothetical protein
VGDELWYYLESIRNPEINTNTKQALAVGEILAVYF